ncbi:MAG: CoA transferase, partial [Gammaproteobacteria bacterium]
LDQSPPSRRRSDVRTGALVAVLPTRDGYVGISPREEHQWAAWLKVMGDPEWSGDERFANARLRQENWLALEPLLIEWTRRHGKEDIYRKAQDAHVPAFPVNTAADLFNSRQLGFRGFFRDVEHPIAGTLPYPGFPYALSNAKLELSRAAPTLGQHDDEVFSSEPRPRGRTRVSGDASLPLAGVRIVDFSWVIAGPTCTRILANMGAEVIKIESAKRPDPTRRGGGANFHFLNQSKRALSLNLRTPRGLELAKALIAKSDVVIENFATGVFERLGLGYGSLKTLRPDIILVSSSGLGHTGPDKDHVAYGTLIQCFTGWSSLTGNPDGRPLPGGVWTDPVTGTLQAFLIASALHNRAQTGLGQYVDFAMAEAVCTMLPEALMDFAMNGRIQGPLGNADPMYAPHGLYPCRGEDRWVAIAVTNDAQWRSLCGAMEREIDDARFATLDGRRAHAEALDAVISEWTRPRDVDEIVTRLQAAGVPAGPSMNGVDVYNDPHLEARGFFATHTSNKGERLRLPGLPWQFRPGPSPRVEPAPDLGEHNSAVLGEVLGLSSEEIQALVDDEVVH